MVLLGLHRSQRPTRAWTSRNAWKAQEGCLLCRLYDVGQGNVSCDPFRIFSIIPQSVTASERHPGTIEILTRGKASKNEGIQNGRIKEAGNDCCHEDKCEM